MLIRGDQRCNLDGLWQHNSFIHSILCSSLTADDRQGSGKAKPLKRGWWQKIIVVSQEKKIMLYSSWSFFFTFSITHSSYK